MSPTLTVLDPTGEQAPVHRGLLVAQPRSLAGVTLGVLDNGKSNSGEFLSLLSARLQERGAVPTVTVRKPGVGRLAPAHQLDTLRSVSRLVVTGVGDCAGCCSCSVQDAIALERSGVPAVLICTAELVTTGRIAATAAGVPDFPLVVVDHPIASCTSQQLHTRVDAAFGQILDGLGER